MAQDEIKTLHFPKAGIDRSMPFGKQPNRPAALGEYARTTPRGINVRGFDPVQSRVRGGSRPGLAKYLPVRPGDTSWITQELALFVGIGINPHGGTVQTSQSGRVVTLVSVSQGNVYVTQPGATTITGTTNSSSGTPPLNVTGIMFSAPNNQKMYFADGVNYRLYDPATNTVSDWTATAGTLPVDGSGNRPRLIETWRGRTMLSGLLDDPQNWFGSRVSVPTDYDYGAVPADDPAIAVAGNNSPLGTIGDVINTMIPYTDDVLVFGGDHTIWLMRGDPAAGGSIDLVSDTIGMAWGRPWCKDPVGTIYFFANRPAIYSMIPGQAPKRISQPIERLLQDVNTGSNGIRLLWDDRFQQLHVFITPLAAPAAATHYVWEARAGAWFQDEFGSTDFNPLTCVVLDGNRPEDRVPLIGSWDGFIRCYSPSATDDDGTPFTASVDIGPILTPNFDEVCLEEMQAMMGADSGTVTWEVRYAATPEQAQSAAAFVSGTFGAGRNLSEVVRRAGHAIFIRLTGTNRWVMEAIRARISYRGKTRRRGR